jgi:ankyrin repeat protein
MTPTRIIRAALLALALALAPTAAAQEPKQALNEQLYEAARRGDAAEVRAVLDRGADVNAKFRYGATALFKAAERGHTEVVKLLIERGADVTVKDTFYGATAMTWALDKGHTGVIRALLAKSADDAGDVLLTGVRGGNAELVTVALETGKVPAQTLTAALVAAAADEKKAAIVELLKKAGAQPPPEVDAATLQSYAGKYKGEPGPEVNVAFKDGKLVVTGGGGPPLTLMSVDRTTFRPTEFDGLTFTFNAEGGKVTGLSVKQGATTTALKRVDANQ